MRPFTKRNERFLNETQVIMRYVFIITLLILSFAGCKERRNSSASYDQTIDYDLIFNPKEFIRIGDLLWAKYNVGATTLPSEEWVNSWDIIAR